MTCRPLGLELGTTFGRPEQRAAMTDMVSLTTDLVAKLAWRGPPASATRAA